MEFSPAFALLSKFTKGLPSEPANEDDVLNVSRYLGVDTTGKNLDDQTIVLINELSDQNRFLSCELESDTVFASAEYHKSAFVREIVANNRMNRANRAGPKAKR